MTLGNVERYTYTMSGDTYIGITKTGMKGNVLGDLPCKYDNCTIKKRKFGAFYFNSDAIFNGKVSFSHEFAAGTKTKIIIDTTKEDKSISIGDVSFTFKNSNTDNPKTDLIDWISSGTLKTITYPQSGSTKVTIKIYDTQILISGLNSSSIDVQIDGAGNIVNTKKIVCGVDITYTENDIAYDYEGFLIKDVIIINDTDLSLYDFIQMFKIKATSGLTRSDYEFSSSSAQIIKRNTNVDRYEVRLAELNSSKVEDSSSVKRFRSYYMLDAIVTSKNNVFIFDDYVFFIYISKHIQIDNTDCQFYSKNADDIYATTSTIGYKTKIYNKNTGKTVEGIAIAGNDKLIFEFDTYKAINGYQDLLLTETFTLTQQRINFHDGSEDKYYYLGFYVKKLKEHIDNNRVCRNGTVTRGASQRHPSGKTYTVDGTATSDLYTGTVLYDGILYNAIIIENIIIVNTIAEKIIAAATDIGDCTVKFQSYKWSTQTTVNVSSSVTFAPRSVYGIAADATTYNSANVGAAAKTYCIDGMRNMDLFNIRNISTDNFSVFVGSCEYTNYLMRDCVTNDPPDADTITDGGSESMEVARGLFLDYDNGDVTSCVIAGNYIFKDNQYAQLSNIITQCRNKNPLIAVNRTTYNSQNPSDYRCDCWTPIDPSKALTWDETNKRYKIDETKLPWKISSDYRYYVMVINVLKNSIGRKTIVYSDYSIDFKFLINDYVYEIKTEREGSPTDTYLFIGHNTGTPGSPTWNKLSQTDYTIESIKEINYSGSVSIQTDSGVRTQFIDDSPGNYDTHIIIFSVTDNDYICAIFNCQTVTSGNVNYDIPNKNFKLVINANRAMLSNGDDFKTIQCYGFKKPITHL